MCPTDFSFGAPPRVSRRSPVNSSFGFKILLSERPPRAPRCCHQRTMLYRMKMFKSQKPSSVDLRVSDFKRVPGFNYVLPVSAEDEHTYNSLCSDIREAWAINASNGLQIYAFPEGSKDESATCLSTRRKCFRASCPFGVPGHPTSARTCG